jgi:hypothetical protein
MSMDDLTYLVEKISAERGRAEVVYVNSLLLDALFEKRFGGVTKFLESIEKSSDLALKADAGAGLGGALLKLFFDLKASITAEGMISEQTKKIVEKELTLPLKARLCEVSLEAAGLFGNDPQSFNDARGRLLRLVDRLETFTPGDEDRLREELPEGASRSVLARWKKDQQLTPGSVQVVLATQEPFPMVAIVLVQTGLQGSTYIAYPPAFPAQRSVLAEPLFEVERVTFLKTYWVIDQYPPGEQ